MRKRGYFFTLDAFIAMGVVAAGLVLAYLSLTVTPYTAQTEFLSQDIIETLANTELSSLNSRYIDEHRKSGNITNMDNTILEQIGEYYVTGKIGEAQNLTRNVTFNLIPIQYGFEIWFDHKLIHNKSYIPSDTSVLTASKTMVIGVINTSFFWGPYEAEVRVWQ